MANTVIALKKSATPSAAPTNLANGELAINYADGKLYYKAANGTISSISGNEPNYFGTVNANNTLVIADTPGDIFTIAAGKNIDIVGDAVNDKLTVSLTNDVTVPGLLSVTAASGDEGGEIRLANAITNSLLSGPVNIDIFRNQLRFFVAGGDARGAFINLAATSAGVGTDLLAAATSTDTIARATASQAFDKANAALPNVSGTWFNGTLTVSQNLVADKIISTNNGDGENFKVGDDAWIGDTNLANALRIKGQQNSSIGYVMFGTNDGKLLGRAGTDSLTYDGNILWHAGNSANASQAFDKANTANITADRAWNHANAAFANGNTTIQTAQSAFTQANLAFIHANAAFASANAGQASANAGQATANAAFNKANTANITADRAWNHANAAFITANIAFANANTVMISAQAAFTVANSSFLHSNAAYAFANSITVTANLAFAHANAAHATANAAFDKANSTTYTSNVVISVADNTNAALRITQTGTADALRIEDDTNPDSTSFIVDANGRLILGGSLTETSFNSTEGGKIQIQGGGGGPNAISIYANTDTVGTSGSIRQHRRRSTGTGAVQTGDTIAAQQFAGHSGTSYRMGAAIYVNIDSGTVSDTSMPGRISFSTSANGSINPTTRMLIDSAGNVLIGRTDSTVGSGVKLDIAGAANASNLLVNGNMVFTHANDGSGSNLDADFLDGQHGSYYGIASDVTAAFAHANAAFDKANSTTYTSNVVISVTDNTNAALRITQTGTGEAIRIEDDTNPDSSPFVVTSNGWTGVGTATPASKFHIKDGGFRATGGDTFVETNLDSAGGYGLTFQKSRGTYDSKTAATSGDIIGGVWGAGHDGTSYLGRATVRFLIDDTVSTGSVPVAIAFRTGSTTTTEYMRIASSGNVLIGRTDSTVGSGVKLDIAGAANASNLLVNGNMVFTAANDGAGSNLDADLLDGQQGSYYGIATDVTAAFLRANTANITADRAWNHANAAFASANIAFANANTVMISAQAAFTVANSGFIHANSGYAFANSIAITANLAFAHANLAFANGNTVIQTAQSAFNQANLAFIHANNAFASANAGQASGNAAQSTANAAFNRANTANITADRAWNHANAAFASANIAFANANTVMVSAQAAFTVANSGFLHANSGYAFANSSHAIANLAFVHANAAFAAANTSGVEAEYAFLRANLAHAHANASYAFANSAHAIANLAFAHANAAFLSSNGVNTYTNSTYVKLTASSQTITGDLDIVGTLTLSGNTVFIDATRLQIDDPLIYLAGNNYTSDIVDIGFIANYVNATGQNVHTGLYREHENKEYYLFQGYDKEPANNHIGAFSNNMTLAVLNADIRTSNLILGGANAILTIGAAFNVANTSGVEAEYAFLRANLAHAHANAAHASANAGMAIANGAFASANAGQSTANAAFNKANTANITADRAWNHANAAFAVANSALPSASYTAADVLAKLITVDGAGTNLDADLLDGQQGSYYGISTDVSAANRVANAAFLHANAAFIAANANYSFSNSAHSIANLAFTHANAAFTKANSALANATGTFSGDLTLTGDLYVNGDQIYTSATSSRTKIHVYSAAPYAIGMQSGITFGGLNDWGMTFQFNNDADRGFWWGHDSHTVAQGAMALTTGGKLTVANSIRVGFGESDSTDPGTNYTLEVNGSFAAQTKSFVINHPTKDDMKLRYGSLEGPENGVYVRGRVQGPYIYLPDYWLGLVDRDSITVSLTPIAKTEMPSVLSWNNEKIVLHSNSSIDCFYHVFAERKDVEKLVVEY